ncbi:MAG: ABC transporter permease subunit [Rhodospirillaceae bacterium]|nr:ABC transporter permease subunit [Rhodospirillaceae bacterium]
MAVALRPLSGGAGPAPARPFAARRLRPLRAVPALTLALFLGPIAAGLAWTVLPAFGWLPELGGTRPSLEPWRALLAAPELPRAVVLSLTSGLAATALSFLIVVGVCAACHDRPLFAWLQRLLAPLLAVPHAALAMGLAFLLAPSGWLARLVSPWLTGWGLPPDIITVGDPAGLTLVLALVVKETPFLLLMTLAALSHVPARRTLTVARTLGYAPRQAWLKAVLPQVYPQIRLPVYAVLAYALSVVDMSLILGPGTPPPLAPLLLRWFNDPDLSLRFPASAGALLQLALVGAAALAWYGGERLVARLARPWLGAGGRAARRGPDLAAAGAAAVVGALGVLSLAALALWSVAGAWRFPAALPASWTLDTWLGREAALVWPLGTALLAGVASTAVALLLAVGCLENEQREGLHVSSRGLWLLYAPLIAPQISFLFGVQVLLVRLGLDGGWLALVWSHLLFVLPYVFLSLAEAWRALDPRYARTALCLGASPARVLWRVKLPILLGPVATAAAVGFAVSLAQYLPTLFAGGGRFATLTTEAVALASGGDRRTAAVYGMAQTVLPLLAFALAVAVSARARRRAR